jgi:HEPN domain-containing protein
MKSIGTVEGRRMNRVVRNWAATANYDLRTADAMYKTGRYLYVVFMCHLAIEKMLKAILAQKYPADVPPKIHNLIQLVQRTEIDLPDQLKDFFQRLDNVSVATRYPEDLRTLSKEFNQDTAKLILAETKRMIKWLKQHLKSET